jgi:hypothetical protein
MPLAPGMKDKLIRRDEIVLPNRKANEYNIRLYILKHFKDMKEIIWLLDTLPPRQVAKLLEDGGVAKTVMDLSDKIFEKMSLPSIQANYIQTEIQAVKRFDLGEDNPRFQPPEGHEGQYIALQPIGVSVSCALTEREFDIIGHTLDHIQTLENMLIPDRKKISRKRFNEIESLIYDERKKMGVKCHTNLDSVEPTLPLVNLLKANANIKERRKTAAMMKQPPE